MSDVTLFSPQINDLDLDPIKFKLMDCEEGEGWSRVKTDSVEKAYRCFLEIILENEGEVVVPSKDVDKFWHAHILDTRKYASDCDDIFGFFLHHFPYLGSRGEADKAALQSQFQRSKRLHANRFVVADDQSKCEIASAVCGGGGGGCSGGGRMPDALELQIDMSTRPSCQA